jgi:hypothetical protein
MKKTVDVGADPVWTLEEWETFIQNLIEQHGKQSVLFTDAGYYNVSLIVEVKSP